MFCLNKSFFRKSGTFWSEIDLAYRALVSIGKWRTGVKGLIYYYLETTKPKDLNISIFLLYNIHEVTIMRIIKEKCMKEESKTGEARCVIRTDTYAHSLDHMLKLFDVAKKDFPDLKPEDVEVVHYGGQCYAKTHGLEFDNPKGTTVPEEYKTIRQLEFTL